MNPIGTLTVVYNRKQRAWEVQGGDETKTFSAGQAGHQQAFVYAVGREFPDLAHAVERFSGRHPQATDRAWSAARLLISGHVLVPDVGAEANCVARVASQRSDSSPHFYDVVVLNETIACNCHDYANRGVSVEGHTMCKHIIAYRLGKYLGWPLREQLPAAPRPRKEAGGMWRGRLVTRVNSIASRREDGRNGVPPNPHVPAYANGEPVSEAYQGAYEVFFGLMRTAPFDEEKLISWYYGR